MHASRHLLLSICGEFQARSKAKTTRVERQFSPQQRHQSSPARSVKNYSRKHEVLSCEPVGRRSGCGGGGPPKLTQDQIDAFLQDGYLVWNNFAPKKLMNLLDKSNKMFHKYTWHANTFEDYTTKSYMGYLESEIFREWDLNGPLKHVTKQILDAHYNQTLSGVRLWNELILATTPSTSGIELHYDRGSYSHLADDAMGVSTWMLLADMDTKEYGQVLAPLNMTMISDECILEGQEGQNFRPHSPECRAATEAAVQYPDVQQGALILFSRWCYHRTAPRRASMPDGFERTLHVARWVHPDVEIKMYTQELDKTGGSRGGNKFAALALGARNYFCRRAQFSILCS